MAEEYLEYDYEDEDNGSGTDLVKKLRKQIDALSKQVKERDEILAEFTTQSHEASVGEILESFGLNPRIAKFIPDEVGDDGRDFLLNLLETSSYEGKVRDKLYIRITGILTNEDYEKAKKDLLANQVGIDAIPNQVKRILTDILKTQ